MKKFVLLSLVVLFIIVPYLNAEEKIEVNEKFYETLPGLYEEVNSTDFRNATWGMSIEEVKECEEKEIISEGKDSEGKDYLAYVDEIAYLDCVVLYHRFVKDKLIEGAYYITGEHTNRNDYIDDYMRLKEALIVKYGEPVHDTIEWKNDLYKDDPENWGRAISIGHLVYLSVWETERTQIELPLWGDNSEIHLFINYFSKELYGLQEQKDVAELPWQIEANIIIDRVLKQRQLGEPDTIIKRSQVLKIGEGTFMKGWDYYFIDSINSSDTTICTFIFVNDSLTTCIISDGLGISGIREYITRDMMDDMKY